MAFVVPTAPSPRSTPRRGRTGKPLQGAHELAVDDAGRERIELPETVATPTSSSSARPCSTSPSRMRSRASATRPSAHAAGSRSSRARWPAGPTPSVGQVAGQHPLVRANDRKPSARRCLTPIIEEPLCPRQPAPHRRHEGGIEEQVHRDANRRPRCRVGVAGLHAQRVRPLPGLDGHVEMPRRVRDLAEDREIGGAREAVCVRLREGSNAAPIAPRRCITCAPDDGPTDGVGHPTP